ncbi:hypothetical protein [Streptomyces sp. CB01580]|uniref:hypothetical protein n=1 Tax=Streptomyces sp. CB01580 TaxID=1703933 RepID=UPI00093F8C2F|nr:hypothetical protein [Streptomyces sp. CB01580]
MTAQTVVTGKVRPVAETKLAVLGLDAHIKFPYGGHGEDHDDRAELVRTAMARSRKPPAPRSKPQMSC